MASAAYEQVRRCRETTAAGVPCGGWARWGDTRCAPHAIRRRAKGGGPWPKHAPVTCTCEAFAFPHRPSASPCRWPEPPLETSPILAGTKRPDPLGLKRLRERYRLPRPKAPGRSVRIGPGEVPVFAGRAPAPAPAPAPTLLAFAAELERRPEESPPRRHRGRLRKGLRRALEARVHDASRAVGALAGFEGQERAAVLELLERVLACEPRALESVVRVEGLRNTAMVTAGGWRIYLHADVHHDRAVVLACLRFRLAPRRRRPRTRSEAT